MKTFYLCALGCPRRRIDSQKISNYLETNGYTVTDDYLSADLIVISTCAFVQDREDQSLQAIDFYRQHRSVNSKMVVAGCLSKINPDVVAQYEGIDFMSPRELDLFDDIINAHVKFKDIPEPNIIFHHPLFLNITAKGDQPDKKKRNVRLDLDHDEEDVFNIRLAWGCLGNCSYCAIKFAVGSLESKPIGEILNEFNSGLAQGFKSFTLVAGDTGCYGIDIGTSIVELLASLFAQEGSYKLIIKEFNAQWLIKYRHELETLLEKNFHKIDYIIIPVQSASDKILRQMKRPYEIEKVKDCLRALKKKFPSLKITTHMMAGFPGETEADFQKSLAFIKEFEFPYVDIYGYESRPRTEASQLDGKIPQAVINQRVKQLRKAQEEVLAKAASAN